MTNLQDTTGDTKARSPNRNERLSPDGKWLSFPKAPNLLQYVKTGGFYGRVKINGKVFRKTLETDVFTVAKLRLSDFLKLQQSRRRRSSNCPVTFKDARGLYEADLAADHGIGENAKRYRRYCIKALLSTWPELDDMKLERISATGCKEWAKRAADKFDAQYFNNMLGTLRGIIALGRMPENPADEVKRMGIKPTVLKLPEPAQYDRIVTIVETAGAPQSKDCADFIRFLAYSGCRLSEARQVTWADVDSERGFITIHSAKTRKTQAHSDTRRVPVTPDMQTLLERLRSEVPAPGDKVLNVGECEKSLARACKIIGIPKLTHHDLRHLFATRCIESGVDIPTVSRWLGHKDGGALAMRVYGHLRDQHSTEMARRVTFGSNTAVENVVPMPKEGAA